MIFSASEAAMEIEKKVGLAPFTWKGIRWDNGDCHPPARISPASPRMAESRSHAFLHAVQQSQVVGDRVPLRKVGIAGDAGHVLAEDRLGRR